eukprot:438990_1
MGKCSSKLPREHKSNVVGQSYETRESINQQHHQKQSNIVSAENKSQSDESLNDTANTNKKYNEAKTHETQAETQTIEVKTDKNIFSERHLDIEENVSDNDTLQDKRDTADAKNLAKHENVTNDRQNTQTVIQSDDLNYEKVETNESKTETKKIRFSGDGDEQKTDNDNLPILSKFLSGVDSMKEQTEPFENNTCRKSFSQCVHVNKIKYILQQYDQ